MCGVDGEAWGHEEPRAWGDVRPGNAAAGEMSTTTWPVLALRSSLTKIETEIPMGVLPILCGKNQFFIKLSQVRSFMKRATCVGVTKRKSSLCQICLSLPSRHSRLRQDHCDQVSFLPPTLCATSGCARRILPYGAMFMLRRGKI